MDLKQKIQDDSAGVPAVEDQGTGIEVYGTDEDKWR